MNIDIKTDTDTNYNLEYRSPGEIKYRICGKILNDSITPAEDLNSEEMSQPRKITCYMLYVIC